MTTVAIVGDGAVADDGGDYDGDAADDGADDDGDDTDVGNKKNTFSQKKHIFFLKS